jgi:hypothetical protein
VIGDGFIRILMTKMIHTITKRILKKSMMITTMMAMIMAAAVKRRLS